MGSGVVRVLGAALIVCLGSGPWAAAQPASQPSEERPSEESTAEARPSPVTPSQGGAPTPPPAENAAGNAGEAAPRSAEEPPAPEVMDRLVVTARPLQENPVQSSHEWIGAAALRARQALSLAEGLSLAASANLAVNSRGETLVYLRNAGERQLAVFYDGAPVNVPWDNRLDLAVIPAAALQGIAVTHGAGSVRYGVSTAGGIVELLPATPSGPGHEAQVSLQAGSGGLADASALWLHQSGPFGLTAAGGVTGRDGLPFTDAPHTEFEGKQGLRRNTDLQRANAALRLSYDAGRWGEYAASLLYTEARFGIAPAVFETPAQGRPRFWRYPQHAHLVAVLRGHASLGPGTELRGSFWAQEFRQTIDSFASSAYAEIEERQEGEDSTQGLRLIATHRWGPNALHGSFIGMLSGHRQRETPFKNGLSPVAPPPQELFRDYKLSFGAEYERHWNHTLELSLGAGGDFFTPLETGGRPSGGSFRTWNVIGGLRLHLSEAWSLRLAAGRKTRLPTLRELFGTAINRFLINPGLRPEEVILLEAGVELALPRLTLEVTPFASLVSGTLDQRNITVAGRTLRQRINLRGSGVYGVEVVARARLTQDLSLAGHLTATHARRLDEADGPDGNYLAERPNLLARLALDYAHPSGFGAMLEVEHRGKAFSLTDENIFAPLSPATQLNARLSYALPGAEGRRPVEFFLRVDNATDSFVEPQLALPAPGRQLRGGLTAQF